MTTQPEALRLADELEAVEGGWHIADACCAELRGLYAENEQLKAVLRRVIRTYMVADDAGDHDAELCVRAFQHLLDQLTSEAELREALKEQP